MLSRGLLALSAAILAAAWISQPAHASTVTSTTTTSGQNTIVTYSVTAVGQEQLSDFHILPPDGTSRRVVKGAQGGGPAGWVGERSGGGAHWKANGNGAITAANSPATFTLTIPTSQFRDGLVRWVTTNDDNYNAGTGQVDAGPGEGESSTHGPLATIEVEPDTANYGTTTNIALSSSEFSRDYEVYVVGTLSGMPDPDNYGAFVTWAASNGVPSGWGLTFDDLTGTLDSSGISTAPSVVIPNNPSLSGQAFYVVAYAETEPDDLSVSYMVPSEPHTITITTP